MPIATRTDFVKYAWWGIWELFITLKERGPGGRIWELRSRPRRSKTLSAGGRRGSANTLIPITASYGQIISRRELGLKLDSSPTDSPATTGESERETQWMFDESLLSLSPRALASILIPAPFPGEQKRARQEIPRHLHCHQRRINITSQGIQPPHPLSQIIAPFFIHVSPQRELSNQKWRARKCSLTKNPNKKLRNSSFA